MGLDMFLFTRRPGSEDRTEVAYWRKHPDLHGFIERTFYKGRDEFNCVEQPLTEADIDQIQDAVRARVLPNTSGFFFGRSYFPEDNAQERQRQDDEDIEKLEKAKDAIRRGDEVFYYAWY